MIAARGGQFALLIAAGVLALAGFASMWAKQRSAAHALLAAASVSAGASCVLGALS